MLGQGKDKGRAEQVKGPSLDMGSWQLWLLLLLSSSGVWTQDDGLETASPVCSRDATRFKHLRKYVYNYEAETTSGVAGTADTRSGSQISCKVELEVPQLCSFILRTSHCSMREVSGTDPEGKALLKKARNTDDFTAAMSKYELKFSIPDGKNVELYPEDDEPTHVLNIKRGIISALFVPMETEVDVQTLTMDTVYGKCDSEVEVKARRSNTGIAAGIAIKRNLKSCDNFNPIRDYVSPIALIKGLNTPLSTLISSNQDCQYSIDTKKKQVSEAVCTEKHLFLPFSYKNTYGMMATVKQTLKIEDTQKINNRDMDVNGLVKRGLALEGVETKSSRNGDAVLKILQELQKLSVTQENHRRTSLFYRFVAGLRGLHNSTLGPLVPKMMETSSSITVQALAQCGTPECFGALLQILRTGNVDPLLADSVTYSLGLLLSPHAWTIQELLNMAQYRQSRATFYALSHAVNRFYAGGHVTKEINDVAHFMTSLIGSECSGDEELTFLTLRALGNMGKAMEETSANVKHYLKICLRSNVASPAIQKAAVQALRKMTVTEEDQAVLVRVFQDASSPVDKRLAAYLMLMRHPSPSDISKVVKSLLKDKNDQVKSFVASHLANILDTEDPYNEELRHKIQEALKGAQVPTSKDFRRFSQHYQADKTVSVPGFTDPFTGRLEGNLLFDSSSYLPKESMLKMTLQMLGHRPLDLFEIGWDGKNFEPTIEALFGPSGFFPDSATKALYWLDGKVPDHVSQALFDYFGYPKDGPKDQDVMKGIMLNFEKVVKELTTKETPEARAYLQIFKEELGYVKLNDIKLLGNLILKSVKTLQMVPEKIAHLISKGTENDLFVHYIFMDNEFELPTGAGLPLQFALSGVATPGAKAGVKIFQKSMQAEAIAKPSVGVEFITHLGVNIPEFARNGVQMNTNIYHESGFEAQVRLGSGQLKLTIPAPKTPTKLLSVSNVLHLVTSTRTEVIPPLIENRESRTSCAPFLSGLNLCTKLEYSNASSIEAAPYYPLTGETRYEVELQPSGEVRQYTLSANYELKKEDKHLVDTVKFTAQVEGVKQSEATLVFRYNRGQHIFTSDLHVPCFNIDFGTNFRITDSSTPERKTYTFILDINNKNVPEVTLTGRIGYSPERESSLEASISIPRLETQAKTDVSLQKSPHGIRFHIDSSATAYGSSISERIVLKHDNEKFEVQWNSGTNAAVKKLSSKLPTDFADYSKAWKRRANELMDQQVANTDMTLRHIVSHFITAANTWLQQASKDVPYAHHLKEKLSGLQDLNFQNMDLITIPEELFWRSDGQIKYVWNKEGAVFTIPLPFGGRSSYDMRGPKTFRTPPLVMESLGVNMPSQEYRIPQFTLPESSTLQIPLLDTFEMSSNVYSNYYNWSSSYTLVNTSKDAYSMRATFFVKADSALDLLSYNMQGQGVVNYDENSLVHDYDTFFQHRLLRLNFKYNEIVNTVINKGKTTAVLGASTPLGARFSLSLDRGAESKENLLDINGNLKARLDVASAFVQTTYTESYTYNTNSQVFAGECHLKLDSSFLQATNQMTGRFSEEEWAITSVSNVQNGFLTNTASLNYQSSQLKLSSQTAGSHKGLAAVNKFDLTLEKQGATLSSEYQVSYEQEQGYALISGSINNRGAGLISHVMGKWKGSKVEHKSTLSMNREGLDSTAMTTVQFSPLMVENEMNARIGMSGASGTIHTSGRLGRHNAKFDLDGKAALTEVVLTSVYQGSISDLDSKNTLNFRINKGGLKFSNSLVGSYKEMKLEHTHDLTIAGFSLAYTSNLDHTISPQKSHKHHLALQLQPYSLTANVNNDLKYHSASVNNKARLQLEPLKVNLDGNVKGTYGSNELKHTYIFTYADLVAHLKTDTIGSIQGAALAHRFNVDVAGLSSTVTVNTNCNSEFLTLTNEIRSAVAPFTITFDMHTNGDGKLQVLGDQSGQLYSKILLKVEPLAFTYSHYYKGSTDHKFNFGGRYNTVLDNKVTVLFTPSEQSSAWTMKSQLNDNVYTQDFSAFNDAEKIGVELSGQTLADLSGLDFPINIPFTKTSSINLIEMFDLRDNIAQPQEFSLSLSVKYDKNNDVHVINLPFLENLPAYYEQWRQTLLAALKSIQKNLRSVNVEQFMRKYKATLDKLPQQVNDYVNSFDLRSKANDLKEKLDAFIKDYAITVDDLQLFLESTKANLQEALSQLQIFLANAQNYIRENYDLKAAVVQLIDQIVEKLKLLDEQYEISTKMVNTIHQLQTIISQFDPSQLGSGLAAWAQNMDTQYKIKAQIQEKLDQLKRQIQRIDVTGIAESLKREIQSINVSNLLEKLQVSLPLEKFNQILEQIKNLLLNFVEDYEVSEKINVFRAKMHELMVNYRVDQHVKVLIDKFVELSNQQKIKETLQKLTTSLKKIDIKTFLNQVLKFVDDAVRKLQTFDYKNLVDEINDFLDVVIQKVRSFDYNKFVDEANIKIQEVTQKINDEIKALELQQKAEAIKQYIKDVNAVISQYIEKLKDTRLAVIIDWFNNILSSTAIRELKTKTCEYLEDVRDRIYRMDIATECQRYLETVGHLYDSIIAYLTHQWKTASEKIMAFAEKYNVKNLAESLNQFVETGFKVPEMRTGIINIPAFEVSLRALREATFETPDFIIPFTDLRVPSYQVNFKNLKNIKIPTRFTTPEFTILNAFLVPSYTIDLNEIKLKIVKTIDQMLRSDFQLPTAGVYFQDLKMQDMSFSDFHFPEVNFPELQVPVLSIPKLNLNEFQLSDIQIPEFQLPRIPHSATIPAFGKLTGTFRVASPFFILTTNAAFHNVTASEHSPEFVASVSAITTSKINCLAFTLIADTRLLAPEMQRLILRDSLKFSNVYIKADHVGEMIFTGTSVQGSSETTANVLSARNAMDLHNKLTVNVQKKISMESKTTYTHRLNIPKVQFTSQAELSNQISTELEAGRILLTSTGKGDWKWAMHDYSDEGTHESSVTFSIGGSLAAFEAENRINDKYLKLNQRLAYEYNLPSSAKLQVASTMESPLLGRSILNLQGTGNLAELKVEVSGTHNAKLSGRISGTLNNDVTFLIQPFEVDASTNNDVNVKVSLPLKIVGKVEFLNNYSLKLSPSTQQVSWAAESRFNQYKYAHNMSAGNNEDSMVASVSMNGDANLDFLKIPLSFPEHSVPYIGVKTPQVQEYSLWEETGLKNFLKTTKQSFDLSLKAQYKKNKDMHSFQIPLDGVHRAINNYIVFFNRHFERGRDKTLAFLTESYNQAKTQFDKYKVHPSATQVPQVFRIPGYTIPVVNIEVSPFTAELPAMGYIIPKEMSTPSFKVPLVGFSVPSYTLVLPSLELPVLHIPQGLQTLKLPSYQTHSPPDRVYIPALGNITYEFSFKSSMITLNTNAGFFNQSDIIARLSSSSTSVIDALQYKLDGTTSLTRKRGLKLATALHLFHKFLEGNHDSTISLTKRNIEASVITTARVNTPALKVVFAQELKGNTKSKPIISSDINLNYDFDAQVATAKGAIAHKISLESVISYISAETSTNGFINGAFYQDTPFSGKLVHEANGYLNSKGARSSAKFEANSNIDGIWKFDTKENVAVEASIHRLYAVWDHTGENYLHYHPLVLTRGNQNCKVTFELAPESMSSAVQIQATQLNNRLGDTSVNQDFFIVINKGNQKIGWTSKNQIQSLFLGHDLKLSNDNTEIRCELLGTLGGHMDFLKYYVLPVYDKDLWDILKLDSTASPEEKQYLNASTSIVYTKNEDGYFIPIKMNRIRIPERLTTKPFDIRFPLLPKIQVPQLDVVTRYIDAEEQKIPYLELAAPEKLLTISQFTLPKTFSLGDMAVDLNAVANKIADFDLPTITVPEQQIEIPAFKVALPAGLFLPKFGALATSFKVASPLYNGTWAMDFKNGKDSFQHSVDFTASSPLQFLEYDLDAVSTYSYEGNLLRANTKGSFSHRDLSLNYEDVLISQGYRLPAYSGSVNIISPTFTDLQVRYQVDSSKIMASASTSSAGSLGFLITLDGDVLKSKIFYQTEQHPKNEVDVFKSEISFDNPEQIQFKANWKEDGAMDFLQGLKEKMPKMANAVYQAVDKYHQEHMGMKISAATLKLKDQLRNNADAAYRDTLNSINDLEQQLHIVTNQATGKYESFRRKAQNVYHGAADQASQMDYSQIRAKLFSAAMDAIEAYNKKVKELIDSSIKFLKVTKLQVPGMAEKHTGEELFVMATAKVAAAVDLCITRLQEYFNAFVAFVNELEVQVPTSSQIIKGSQILDEMKGFLTHVHRKVNHIFAEIQEIDFAQHLRDLKEVIQQIFQKVEELIRNVQAQNYEYVNAQVKQAFTNLFQGLKSLAPRTENIIQNTLQSSAERLGEFLQSVTVLREEYFDPSIVGWSVKYYEVEEKVLEWLKRAISALIEWHTKNVSETADLVARLAEQVKEMVANQEALTNMSQSAQGQILYWSEAARKSAADQNKRVKVKLQEAYEYLPEAYERLINETVKLIDLTIENYTALIQYLQQLLDRMETTTAETLRPYIVIRQGELRVDIPKPFDLPSFYLPPQSSQDDLQKK